VVLDVLLQFQKAGIPLYYAIIDMVKYHHRKIGEKCKKNILNPLAQKMYSHSGASEAGFVKTHTKSFD